MSARRLRAAGAVWQARTAGSMSDRAYRAYLLVMVAITAIAPVARMLWLGATGPLGAAMPSPDRLPVVFALLSLALWAGALLIGIHRGPALRPPLLLHALLASELQRSESLRGVVVRTTALTALATTAVAGFAGAALVDLGLVTWGGFFALLGAACASGVVATLCGLIGQAYPRAAVIVALSALAATPLVTAITAPSVALSGSFLTVGAAGLVGLAFVLATLTPMMLNSLRYEQLLQQATNWHAAVTFSATLDFSLTATVYQEHPRVGRRLRAVRGLGPLPLVFFLRDAVGLARTPGRLAVSVVTTAVAGMPTPVLGTTTAFAVPLAAGAALLLYLASGALGQGMRYAAQVAADYPLYGVSDGKLVAYHSLFPLVATSSLVAGSSLASALLFGAAMWAPMVCGIALVALILAVRLSAELRGPLPPRLLAPIESPVGDLSIVVQLVWAFGAPLMALLSGVAVALLPLTPTPLLATIGWVTGSCVIRWRHR